MEKTIIHTLKVEQNGEKTQFQIKLPRDTKRITSVLATASPSLRAYSSKPPKFASEVGWLWLRQSNANDVFYSDIIKRQVPRHAKSLPGIEPINDFSHGAFQVEGTRIGIERISVPVNSQIIEGYFIDRITTQRPSYLLRIYLTLEL